MGEVPIHNWIALGMRCAGEHARINGHLAAHHCILKYAKHWEDEIDARAKGVRRMVRGDIFMDLPMMHPGDLGMAP